MTRELISGVLPVLPTVFTETNRIDSAGYERVAAYVLGAGAHGVVFPGLASEYDQLSMTERLELTALTGQLCTGRAAFVVGASAADPDEAITYAKAGADAGADAAMIITPHAFAGDIEGLKSFYASVSEASGLPIMLQNAPKPMGIALSVDETVHVTRAVPNIDYVKEETAPCGQRISAIRNAAPHLAGVFGGAGGRQVIDEIRRGSRGTLPASEITELHVEMWNAHVAGNERHARDLFDRSLPLLMMQMTYRWRLTKEVLMRRGLIEHTHVRAPGPCLDAGDQAELDILLDRLSDVLSLPSPTAGQSAAASATG